MRTLVLDTETRSPCVLKDTGAYVYSEHAAAHDKDGYQLLMFSWQFLDEAPTQSWGLENGAVPDEFMSALTNRKVRKVAHNAQFDRVVLSRLAYGRSDRFLDPSQWMDTMALAAVYGMPKSLDRLTKFLGVGKKMTEGRSLIQFFNKASNMTLLRGALDYGGEEGLLQAIKATLASPLEIMTKQEILEAPAARGRATEKKKLVALLETLYKWQTYRRYNVHDTDILVDVVKALPSMPKTEQQFWVLDQEINDRGVQVDLPLAKAAEERMQVISSETMITLKRMTGCVNPRSIPQFKEFLEVFDVSTPSLDKAHVVKLLQDPQLPDVVRTTLELRPLISSSSVAKFSAMHQRCNSDSRARGCFQYFGAHTGRAAGRGIQLQNLPRVPDDQVEATTELAEHPELVSMATLEEIKRLLRPCLVAGDAGVFTIADFSAIEARVTAWLAEEEWQLVAFRAGLDIYKATWAQMSGLALEDVGAEDRQRGKVASLALGFGGGVQALLKMGGARLPIPEEFPGQYRRSVYQMFSVGEAEVSWGTGDFAELALKHTSFREWLRTVVEPFYESTLRDAYLDHLKLLWRRANPHIKAMWRAFEQAFRAAAFTRATTKVGRITFAPGPRRNSVRVELPSGRPLYYWGVRTRMVVNDDGEERERLGFTNGLGLFDYTHGGVLTENIVQATARDLLRDAMIKADAMGARIVAHIHDEIVAEGEIDLLGCMTEGPDWADDLPLGAAGVTSSRYLGH